MRKINILGKQLPVMVLALVLMAGMGSAAILSYYGQTTTIVTTQQSVLVDGQSWDDPPIIDEIDTTLHESVGGEEFCFKHILENQASVDANVGFEDTCDAIDTDSNWMNCNGVTTTYYTIPETLEETTIELSSKNPTTWVVTGDRKATLTYDTVNPDFVYTLSASGLETDTEYALIYYADEDPRFDKWENVNGMVIGTFSSDGAGVANVDTSINLKTHLPIAIDWNVNPDPDYCGEHNDFDSYVHCAGAKFWIVPLADIESSIDATLKAWNPTAYLFETDLGFYYDCSIKPLPANYPVDKYGTEETGTTIKTGQDRAFFVCHSFNIAITPGTYTITTNVVPS